MRFKEIFKTVLALQLKMLIDVQKVFNDVEHFFEHMDVSYQKYLFKEACKKCALVASPSLRFLFSFVRFIVSSHEQLSQVLEAHLPQDVCQTENRFLLLRD